VSLTAGTRLGPYEILSPLGAGGMGEVYRARDTRLDRTVAVKVLKGPHSERFEREARAISQLNHPHICTLYDVGPDYLVMEYLEGETLAARLARGPLPPDQVIRHALQIADALTQAHRQGVFHRDLKPGNIMLTKAGAKLLDFGLARFDPLPTPDAPTVTDLTAEGAVVGTIPYMAPEQLRGQPTDARSDIFSFGALLFEMVTGRRAFPAQSQADLIAAILESDLPVAADVPPELDWIIRTCLAKDPDERWQTARDLSRALQRVGAPPAPPVREAAPARRSRLALLAAAVLILAAVLLLRPRTPPPPTPVWKFAIPPPENASFFATANPAVSPDGRWLAFVATSEGQTRLWVRRFDSLLPQPLLGSEGPTFAPFWSPDSRSIGFFAQGKLKRVTVPDGPVQSLCDAPNTVGGAWNSDGTIVFSGGFDRTLFRIPASGGVPVQLTRLDASRREVFHGWPNFLPDGRRFLYLVRSAVPENTGVYISSLDSPQAPRGKPLVAVFSLAAFAPPGFLLYVRDGILFAHPFDHRSLALTGDPFAVAELSGPFPSGRSMFSVSSTGVLAYRTVASAETRLLWYDRQGKQLGPAGPSGLYAFPRLSADGKQLAFHRANPTGGGSNIWVLDLPRQTLSRVTLDGVNAIIPIWSPDRSRIVFSSNRGSFPNLYQKPLAASAPDDLLVDSSNPKFAEDISPDGRFLVYSSGAQGDKRDLWVLPLFGERKPSPWRETPFNESGARFSPDGRWLAYSSDEPGNTQVFIEPFPPPASGSASRLQVSTQGGDQPEWGSATELFYVAPGNKLMAVRIHAGPPQQLFEISAEPYQVADGGRRFLVSIPAGRGATSLINVVANFAAASRNDH
jgi:serine/threonine protein kinase